MVYQGIKFLKSARFKTIILRFLNFGDQLPVVLKIAVRLVLGSLLMLGGVFWFLPILGLWMFPLGILMIGTCIPFFDRKIRRWGDKLETEISVSKQKDSEDWTEPQQTDKFETKVNVSKQKDTEFVVDQLNPKQARRRARNPNSRKRR